jgi:hypothetical protein
MNHPTPGLRTVVPGLRTVNYDARSAAKVSLVVQPGDTLIVSDDVADQLAASSAQFKTEAPPEAAQENEDAPQSDEAETSEDGNAPAETPAATAKRATRKRAAKPKG